MSYFVYHTKNEGIRIDILRFLTTTIMFWHLSRTPSRTELALTSKAKIDEIDISIIRALQKDARENFAVIAKNCGTSTDTISKRFRKLRKNNIIVGTTVLLNPKIFGYDCIASLGIDAVHPHLKEVIEWIQAIPETIFCTASTGKHDIFCIVVLKNVGRLSQVKDLIKGHPMVREVTTSIWVDDILLCPQNFEFEHHEKD